MRIKETIAPEDIGNFRDLRQARAYKLALEIKEDIHDIAEDLRQLDDGQLDLRQKPGELLLDSTDVLTKSKRKPERFYQTPVGEFACDVVYEIEKRLSGEASFDVDRKLTNLEVGRSHFKLEFWTQKANPANPEREVYSRRTQLWPDSTPVVEQMIVNKKTGVITCTRESEPEQSYRGMPSDTYRPSPSDEPLEF